MVERTKRIVEEPKRIAEEAQCWRRNIEELATIFDNATRAPRSLVRFHEFLGRLIKQGGPPCRTPQSRK
jgi:hypothetical protein